MDLAERKERLSRGTNWIRNNLEKINDPKTLNPGDRFFAIDNTPGGAFAGPISAVVQIMQDRGPVGPGELGIIYVRPPLLHIQDIVPESFEFYKAGNHQRIPVDVLGGKKRSKKTRKMLKSRKQTYRKRR